MISITNIQKNIRRAEVWGNIAVLRCGCRSGSGFFLRWGVCDSEIPARIFGVFVVVVVVVVVVYYMLPSVVVVYGFASLLRCSALSARFTLCFASNTVNKYTQTYDFFCAIFLLTINKLCNFEKIF